MHAVCCHHFTEIQVLRHRAPEGGESNRVLSVGMAQSMRLLKKRDTTLEAVARFLQ